MEQVIAEILKSVIAAYCVRLCKPALDLIDP